MIAVNLAAHEAFNFGFMEHAQSVTRFHERTGVDLVIRADNRRHAFGLVVDGGEVETVAEFGVAFVVATR